jgi:hypothetical protein
VLISHTSTLSEVGVQLLRSALAIFACDSLASSLTTGRISRSSLPKACWLRFWSLTTYYTNSLPSAAASHHPRHSCQRLRGTHSLVALLRPVRAILSKTYPVSHRCRPTSHPHRDLVVRQLERHCHQRANSDLRSLQDLTVSTSRAHNSDSYPSIASIMDPNSLNSHPSTAAQAKTVSSSDVYIVANLF